MRHKATKTKRLRIPKLVIPKRHVIGLLGGSKSKELRPTPPATPPSPSKPLVVIPLSGRKSKSTPVDKRKTATRKSVSKQRARKISK